MKQILLALLILISLVGCYPVGGAMTANLTGTENFTATENASFIPWKSSTEIRQFVRESGFSKRYYELGVYDCITYENNIYFGFALDFVEYGRERGRLFIPYAEYTRGGKMWHLKTITFIGNNVYSVDPMFKDGRVYLFGRVD